MLPFLAFEVLAFINIFRPVDGNSFKKKLTLVVLLLMWVVLELGMFFLQYDAPGSMWWIRLLALYIIGRAHGIERARIDNLRGEK